MISTFLLAIPLIFAGLVSAHLAAWHKGMYCLNGTNLGHVDYNTRNPVTPLWNLKKSDYWFHHISKCDEFPPAQGDFLELPAGGTFTVEIASGRGLTTLSDNGKHTSEWPDGNQHPEGYSITNLGGAPLSPSGCIREPNIHTQNETMAAGTSFAIAYVSDIKDVTLDNLVVFSVRSHTPWKRVTTYDVPAGMPACPSKGCICTWNWIPNGCGEPNMYMQGFKCMVTSPSSSNRLASPKPPIYCASDKSECVRGAKQIMIWNQAEGNNVGITELERVEGISPGYNWKWGFQNGAQHDIFESGKRSERLVKHRRRFAGVS